MSKHDYTIIHENSGPTEARGVSPSTAVKRRERFRHFERWCASKNVPAMPTTASVLARYVHEHVGLVEYLTQRARVEAVRAVHRSAGVDWFDDEPVKWALEAARDAGGTRASQPLVEHDLADLARLLIAEHGADAIRDWALIAFGAAAGLDGRELGALAADDVVIDADGATLPTFVSPWGEVPRIPRLADSAHCPIQALEVWMALRDPDALTLFHALDADGRAEPLRAVDITAIVRRRMHAIGRDHRRYSAASLKAHRFYGRSAAGAAR